MQKRLLILAFSFTALLASVVAKENPSNPKQPILIIPGEVTINGVNRPDLGRSFCDSITGKLLQSGMFTIVDQVSNDLERAGNDGKNSNRSNPEAIVKQLAGKTKAQYALIARMVSEDDFSKFSIKKLRVTDSEVLKVYQSSTVNTERAALFDLLEQATNNFLKEAYQEQARIRRKNRPSIIEIQVPKKTDALEQAGKSQHQASQPVTNTNTPDKVLEAANVQTELATKEDAPKTAQYAGRICAIDAKWHFCVIELENADLLQVDDLLLVRTEHPEKALSRLNVSRIEGNKAIADFQDNAIPSLRNGLKVYRWGVVKSK